ncbi:group III truncated hemoglobin [Tabrizicola sp. KVB23]|uniref:Group III truncated hemoglobin n=1 Tax=Fuscibacter oryzae TaxID=2803939 RepID=A0A8J7SUD3_9RHOB|nr:group III truncated hemoglobin [Fuscibacter oryzae]
MIALVVQRFYARVRADAVLGPIFTPRVEDWPDHEAKITRFWSSVLLMSGEYHGSPMQVHLNIPALGRTDFDRWLALFDEALTSSCNADQAAACQSARKTDPLSASKIDPPCGASRSGPEPTELITEWRRVRP